MKEDFTTFERRMEILSMLLNHKQISQIELARRFSVSDVTIYSDVNALSRFAPICSRLGRYGGIYLMDGFSLRKAYLSRDEEELLKELSKGLTGKRKMLLQTIIHKFAMPK